MKTLLGSLVVAAVLTVSLVPRAEARTNRVAVRLGPEFFVGAAPLALVEAVTTGIVRGTQPYMAAPTAVPFPQEQWTPERWPESPPPTAGFDVWVPGHHDAYGNWNPSHYQSVTIPGRTPVYSD
jgi:hypothetical protein